MTSSNCGRPRLRLRRPRMPAWCLVSLLLLIGTSVSAEPSGPGLTIDYDKFPVIAFEARNVPVVEVLNQLAAALHIEVEYAAPVDNSRAISGSFEGEFGDILGRVLLSNGGYVVSYRGAAIDRIFITRSGSAALAAAADAAGEADAAPALDPLPVPHPAATMTVDAAGRGGTKREKRNPVSNLLQAQADMMVRAANVGSADGSNASVPAAPRPTVQASVSSAGAAQTSLAAMTQAAQANVRMLAKALNTVCIGANCAQ
jgi:hypothetical protein